MWHYWKRHWKRDRDIKNMPKKQVHFYRGYPENGANDEILFICRCLIVIEVSVIRIKISYKHDLFVIAVIAKEVSSVIDSTLPLTANVTDICILIHLH